MFAAYCQPDRQHNSTGSLAALSRLATFALLIAAFVTSIAHAQSGNEAVHEIAQSYFEEAGFPGMAVSIGHNGVLAYSEGFGYSDIEQKVPVIPGASRFRIGSVSKSMTAMAVGQLVEKGLLDLDAPVQQYVPEYPEKRGPVTTRLVAGHLAGIRHYRGSEFFSQQKYNDVVSGLDIFKSDTLLFEPGSAYSYSSYGWNLISVVVERAAGTPFLEYMADSVFAKAGMIRSVADHTDRLVPDRTAFYVMESGQLRPAPFVDNSYKWAGGGFLSTSDDLVAFGFAHLNGTVSQNIVRQLWMPQTKSDGEKTNYGIGWASGVDEYGRQWVGHNGGSVGGTTRFRIYPEEEVVIAIITNMSGGQFGSLADDLVNAYLAE